MSKYDQDHRDPISPTFAHETFSKAGFKPHSAICEIVDNSIEANAKNIIIRFEWKKKSSTQTSDRIDKFIFIDDGEGMDEHGIYDYFVAAESTKRNNSSGIGKFGVGAYLSCISQAEIGEVYSKTRGGKWLYTTLRKGEKIPKPKEKDPPVEYNRFDHGTIVMWLNANSKFKKSDIENKKETRKRFDYLTDDLGRIYRKFLTEKKLVPDRKGTKLVNNNNVISIQIESGDAEPIQIEPYDPLFHTYNRRKSDKDKPEIISTLPHKFARDGNEGYMYVTFSLLPTTWWLHNYRPGIAAINTNERQISELNEGISLVREGRELYFGPYPGGPIKLRNVSESPSNSHTFEPRDRWVGIEIEFTRDADELFGVEFNKTRISIEKDARDEISKAISDTIMSRRRFFSAERDKSKSTQSPKPIPPSEFPEPKPKEVIKLKEFAAQFKAKHENTEEVYDDLLKGYHISRDYDQPMESPFISFEYMGDSVLVRYNMSHSYMKRLSKSLKMDDDTAGKDYADISTLIGILFASYGFSRRQFSDISDTMKIEDVLEDIIMHWTKSVRRWSSNMPE